MTDAPRDHRITDRLNRGSLERDSGSAVLNLLYDRLHEIASWQLADQGSDPILQTTMVVNEAYLRLARSSGMQWGDRQHFFRSVLNSCDFDLPCFQQDTSWHGRLGTRIVAAG